MVRERTVKAISFAKLLRKDLEVSAEFSIIGSIAEVLTRLQETDHVQVMIYHVVNLFAIINSQVVAPHSEQHLVFVPRSSAKNQESVLELLDMKFGNLAQRSANKGGAINENLHSHSYCAGYLILVEHSLCSENIQLWDGDTIHVKPTAESTIALAQIQVIILCTFVWPILTR